MTIDEAIKRLEIISEEQDEDWLDFEYAALQLGIEALKREKAHRLGGVISTPYLLAGETE